MSWWDTDLDDPGMRPSTLIATMVVGGAMWAAVILLVWLVVA